LPILIFQALGITIGRLVKSCQVYLLVDHFSLNCCTNIYHARTWNHVHAQQLGMKTEQIRTELSGATFVFTIFLRKKKRMQKPRKQKRDQILSTICRYWLESRKPLNHRKKKFSRIQTSQQSNFLILAWSLIYYGIREAKTLEASTK
jgi:hypothetical protein